MIKSNSNEKNKLIVVFSFGVVASGILFYLINRTGDNEIKVFSNLHVNESRIIEIKNDELKKLTVSKINRLNNDFLDSLKNGENVKAIYNRSLKLFENSPQKEEMANWISAGWSFDLSQEYVNSLNGELEQINKNPYMNFKILEEATLSLSEEDSFIRGQILNLANQLKVTKEEKIKFFGAEMTRVVVLDSQEAFSPDSLNITTAMIFLKDNGASADQIEYFKNESLLSNPDLLVKKKLLARFKTYF